MRGGGTRILAVKSRGSKVSLEVLHSTPLKISLQSTQQLQRYRSLRWLSPYCNSQSRAHCRETKGRNLFCKKMHEYLLATVGCFRRSLVFFLGFFLPQRLVKLGAEQPTTSLIT